MVKKKKIEAKRAGKQMECCSFCGCGDDECCKNEKTIKVYFCPRCKSKEVGFIFGLKNIFGIIPRMRCRKCGYTGIFPQLVISQKKLTQLNKKYKGKK